MRDDRGVSITDEQVLDRVGAIGAIVDVRGPVESTDFETCRRELRRAARGRGLRLSMRRSEEIIVVNNPEHVITDEQRRAAFAKIAADPTFFEPPPGPSRRHRNPRAVPPRA